MKHPRTKFKTILALLLDLCLLAACGRQPGTEEPEVSTAAPAVPAETPTEPAAPEVPVTPPAEVPAIPTVGNLSVESLQVVYPTGRQKEEGFANTIADALRETYSCDASVVADSDPALTDKDGLILVGDCKQLTKLYTPAELTAGDSYIAADDRSILVTGGSALSLYGAVTEFADRIRETGGGNLTLAPEEMFTPEYSTTRVMSFNILGGSRSWERTNRVKTMITNYMPDSLGLQEDSQSWIISLMGHFNDLNLPYEFIGAGNDGGEKNSESVGIFYRADKFTLLDSGTKWLSTTPDVPSKFENAQGNRAVTYAVLQNKETGKTFVHMNTHLDTNTHLQGKTRDQQAEVLAGIIQEFKDYPVIVTGDFNSRPNTAPHKLMHEIGLVSSGDVAAQKHGHETFHKYGQAAPDCIIDYLFITPKNMAAVNYRVCNEKIDGDYPSDHHPVIADVIIW